MFNFFVNSYMSLVFGSGLARTAGPGMGAHLLDPRVNGVGIVWYSLG